MNRLTLLASTASVLFFANSMLWGFVAPRTSHADDVGFQGCLGATEPLPSKEKLVEIMNTELPQSHPTAPCTGCSLVMDTTQTWCKLRPPSTECFTGPIFDNFRWQRPYKVYECSGGNLGVCCGSWVQNGCCNDSGSEPDCWDDDEDFVCSEKPNCP